MSHHRWLSTLALALALAGSPGRARAQPTAPVSPPPPVAAPPAPAPASGPAPSNGPEVPLDILIEHRVTEELAVDGTSLSRLGVVLDVELVGESVLISLLDLATRAPRASTKLDALPADREAAIASVMQATANLTPQLTREAPGVPEAVSKALAEDRRLREERELARERADAAYARDAITFGDSYDVVVGRHSATLVRRWEAYRGANAERTRMDAAQFYSAVGRPDLLQRYERRRGLRYGMLAGGIVLAGASMYFLSQGFGDPALDDFDSKFNRNLKLSAVSFAGAAVVGLVGIYLWRNPHPISEGEAHELARGYNDALRRRPVASRQSRVRDVKLSAYADAGGGGLALGGRF